MNGQERSQALTSSSFAVSNVPVNSAAITGVVKSNSWLRDMVADPAKAAEAGLLNQRQDRIASNVGQLAHMDTLLRHVPRGSAPLRSALPSDFTNPLLKGHFNASFGAVAGPQGELSRIDPSISDQNRLLVSCAATSQDTPVSLHSAAYHHSSKNHMTYLSSAESEVAAKRMKMTKPMDRNSLPMPPVQHSQQASIPHRPEYFRLGSVIQLGESQLKRIEDLQTSDFEYSASISPDLSLDSSTVVKISEDSSRGTAHLTFSVGDHKHNPLEATVEATLEHPFFVFGQGWSSVKPESTFSYYKLKCQQLKLHDRCISLTLKDTSSINSSNSFGNHYGAASADSHLANSNTEKPQSK